ncbi:MAG: hypothetical protein M3165_07355 [Actinomycetota bacterium]|nr:hypothetical protein [Actinomycetota bacterium]
MLLTTVVAQSAEETAELPADPLVFGVSGFVILAALLVGVLMFGKGRPHA